MVPTPTSPPLPNQAGHAAESVATALQALEQQWALSDALFDTHVPPKAALDSPIHLRNPYIFYIGHLPSFASTRLLAPLAAAPRPDLDTLFLRGRDPDVDGPDPGLLDKPWPSRPDLLAYCDDVRHAVRLHAAANVLSPRVIRVVAEHEAMHVETLYYMISQNLKADYLREHRPHHPAPAQCPDPVPEAVATTTQVLQPSSAEATEEVDPVRPHVDWVPVAAGSAALGRDLSDPSAPFGWDNEARIGNVQVKSFRMARHAVSVSEFARFVAAAGYADTRWWAPADWEWVCREQLDSPQGWVLAPDGTVERVCTGVGPGAAAAAAEGMPHGWRDWPVSVSLAEGRAYAKWVGARLPTEAEWVRAAYNATDVEGKEEETEEEVVVGDGNDGIHVQAGQPTSVRDGEASWCGVVAMVGNGWELTETVLTRFDDFVEMEEYPEYTADFFDDKHFVLKGASWATPRLVVRRSFRNYYQARYPYVFSKFRLVLGDDGDNSAHDAQA